MRSGLFVDIVATHQDFTELDIVQRNAKIMQRFTEYLREYDLIQPD